MNSNAANIIATADEGRTAPISSSSGASSSTSGTFNQVVSHTSGSVPASSMLSLMNTQAKSKNSNQATCGNKKKTKSFTSKKSVISIASTSSNITVSTNESTMVTRSVTSTNSSTLPLFGASFPATDHDKSEGENIVPKSGNAVNGISPPFSLPPFSPPSTMTNGSNNSNSPNSSSHLLLRHPDAIPTLISLLSSPNRDVHEQALWILGSIAAGEGASSPVPNPSSSALTNFANANMPIPNHIPSLTNPPNSSPNSPTSVAQAREQVLQAGAMDAILSCLEANPNKISLQRIGSWTLSNLIDVQYPQPNSKKPNKNGSNNSNGSNIGASSSNQNPDINIKSLLPTLKRLLYTQDAEVLSHTCWALSHLCDGPSSHISVVVSPAGGLVPRLVELLLHPSWRVTKPALRTIGNVVCAECVDDTSHSGDHHSSCFPSNGSSSTGGIMIPVDYTETILECGAVPRLKQLITHGNREIQKEACWTLSNIAAGAVDQIQAVIDSGAIAPLVKLASDPSADQEVRSEACWVVLNATSCGSDAQIEVLVKEGCVSVLGVLLGEQSMVMMALEGLERVLQVEEGKELQRKNYDGNILTDSKSLNASTEATTVVSASLIEALEKHKNSAVAKRAGKIWKDHFVSCALCHQSFSRHKSFEAHFCNECKCHVCKNCDCTIYHLSYQEEFWAATEETAQAKNLAKKSKKNKKKMKKKKQKKRAASIGQLEPSPASDKKISKEINESTGSSRINIEDDIGARSRSSSVASYSGSASGNDRNQSRPPINELAVSDQKHKLAKQSEGMKSLKKINSEKNNHSKKQIKSKENQSKHNIAKKESANRNDYIQGSNKTASLSQSDDDGDFDGMQVSQSVCLQDESADSKKDKDCSDVDLVLYLQQTGSIIALSRLLDQLDGDFSISNANDKEEEQHIDLEGKDNELKMLNHETVIGAARPSLCRNDN